MDEKKLDSTILEFRDFLNKTPKLKKEVRQGEGSIQAYYEKWVLLGESDPFWDKYKHEQVEEKKSKADKANFVDKLRRWGEETDMDQIQERVKQWDQTISMVQGMLSQYQEGKQQKVSNRGYYNKYRD